MIINRTKYLFLFSFATLLFSHSLLAQNKSQHSSIMLRGKITTSQVPLILLNGIVFDATLSITSDSMSVDHTVLSQINLDSIDPSSVENISVLKGDSNTAPYVARYGASAKNGVILISTKKSIDKIQKE